LLEEDVDWIDAKQQADLKLQRTWTLMAGIESTIIGYFV